MALCEDPRGPTGHKWIGYSLFVPLDRTTAGKNAEQQTDDKNVLKPKMLKIPAEPSESESRLRELTPKGRQSHAVKKNDRQPVIQIDFSFLSTENDLPKRTILNATDVQTGYAMAIVLPAKRSIEKYAVAELRRFVLEFTEGDCQGPLQDDWRIVAASSTDWTLPESRKCAKDLVRSTKDTVLASARVDWLEVDIGISNVRVVCENMRNG